MGRASLRSPWPTPAARARDREAKPIAVLYAAVQLFNERSFSTTSLDEVAARLNVTKPILYRYFTSKDQILFECVRLGLEQLLEAASTAADAPGSAFDRMGALMRRYALIMTQDFGICVIRTGDHELSTASRRQFRALKRKIDMVIRGIIAEGIVDGSIARCDVRMTAFAIAGALNWVARWYDSKGPQQPDDLADAMVAVLARLITPTVRLLPGA